MPYVECSFKELEKERQNSEEYLVSIQGSSMPDEDSYELELRTDKQFILEMKKPNSPKAGMESGLLRLLSVGKTKNGKTRISLSNNDVSGTSYYWVATDNVYQHHPDHPHPELK